MSHRAKQSSAPQVISKVIMLLIDVKTQNLRGLLQRVRRKYMVVTNSVLNRLSLNFEEEQWHSYGEVTSS